MKLGWSLWIVSPPTQNWKLIGVNPWPANHHAWILGGRAYVLLGIYALVYGDKDNHEEGTGWVLVGHRWGAPGVVWSAPGPRGEEAQGPQAESTLTSLASLVSPSLVGKWFTGIGRQGSPRFWEHFDLIASPFICLFDLYLKSFFNKFLSYWFSSKGMTPTKHNAMNIWNCSQFPLFANFLILGAAAGSRKTGGMVPLSSAIAPSTSVNCAQLCVYPF